MLSRAAFSRSLLAQSRGRTYATVKAAAGTFASQKNANGNYTVSMIAGDGIGPEISVSIILLLIGLVLMYS